jgi:hypothetical protein
VRLTLATTLTGATAARTRTLVLRAR